MENQKGKLFIISGPSGSGKGEVCKKILGKGVAELSISATTRAPRPGEVDGENYFFISKEEFLTRIESESFLEHARYNGNYYGTPKEYVVSALEKGKNIILEIDVQGALRVKEMMPEAVLIMISAPDNKTLSSRLAGRGDTSEDDMFTRLKTARWELEQLCFYDYLVVNPTGELEKTADTVCEIINGIEHEECSTVNNRDFSTKFYS